MTLIQPTGAHTTVTYTYTPLNQLATETDPSDPLHVTSFLYDALGRQIARTGVTTTFGYNQLGQQVTETTGSDVPDEHMFDYHRLDEYANPTEGQVMAKVPVYVCIVGRRSPQNGTRLDVRGRVEGHVKRRGRRPWGFRIMLPRSFKPKSHMAYGFR